MYKRVQPSPTHFRLDIHGLRSIAVLSVIGDPLLNWPHGGFVGVDIFFVISGFLITGLLLREYINTGSISFTHFYERRIKRILPVATFVLVATIFFTYPLWGEARTKLVIQDAIASALFLGNWQFARNDVDYFQQDMPPSPLQHYWSLSVEEQFYFIWPWLLLGLLFLGFRFFKLNRHRANLVAGATIAVLSVASLAWAFHETSEKPTLAYFSTFSRGWELGIGALLAASQSLFERMRLFWGYIFGVLGGMGVAASLYMIDAGMSFPAPWAMLPVFSTALLIAAGTVKEDTVPLLGSRVSRYLGDISFSLYLWHFPVVVLLPSIVVKDSWLYFILGLFLTFSLSDASYRWLEQPARRGNWFRWSSAGKLRGFSSGSLQYVAAIFLVAFCSFAAVFTVNSVLPPLAKSVPAVLWKDITGNLSNCRGAAALDPSHACASLNPENIILPRPADAARDQQGAYECYIGRGESFRTCTYGSTLVNAKRVALVGDSHAASMLPALKPQLDALNWRLDVFIGNGCKWTTTAYRSQFCAEIKPQIQKNLLNGSYDLIIATGTRAADATAEMHKAAIAPFLAKGQRIVVIDDNPDPSIDSVACVQRVGFSFARECGTPREEAYSKADTLSTAARELNIPVVYQEKFYCINNSCPSAIGNVLVYKDVAGHVTASYAETVGPYLIKAIQDAVGQF